MAAAAKSKGKGKATAKRKRVVLTIEDKLEVLSLLDESVSRTVVSEKFGIGRVLLLTFGRVEISCVPLKKTWWIWV